MISIDSLGIQLETDTLIGIALILATLASIVWCATDEWRAQERCALTMLTYGPCTATTLFTRSNGGLGISSVHVVLSRLESRGLVESSFTRDRQQLARAYSLTVKGWDHVHRLRSKRQGGAA